VILQIWDTAGQERFQSLSSAFYRGADCCCLVYDVTKEETFEALLNWKQIFMTKSAPNDPDSFPFLVIGNKVDMQDNRKVSTLDGKKFSSQNGNMLFYECSAKNNFNVDQAFRDLGAAAIKRQMVNSGESLSNSGQA
jgi:Ras-related protein Rab-7A